VFFIAAGVYAFGGIVFCALASGTTQPWATNKNMRLASLKVAAAKKDSVVDHGDDSTSKPQPQSNGELTTDPKPTENA